MVPEFTKKLHQPFKQIRFTVSPTSSTSSTRAILRGLSFGPSKALAYSNLDTTSKTTRPTKPTPSQTHTTSKAARDETAMDRVPTRTHRPSRPPPTQPAGHPSPPKTRETKKKPTSKEQAQVKKPVTPKTVSIAQTTRESVLISTANVCWDSTRRVNTIALYQGSNFMQESNFISGTPAPAQLQLKRNQQQQQPQR